MHAIKARFDGQRIVLPPELKAPAPSDVIVIFEDQPADSEDTGWQKAQEQTLAKVWDNAEDADYDRL
jgi:hypothetical protein